MFVVILPWLYCPLVWCIYNLVFQLVGNIFLLFGLLVLAYAPMAYFAIGMSFNITRPMDSATALFVTRVIGVATGVCAMASYALVIYFAFWTVHPEYLEVAWVSRRGSANASAFA